MAKKKKSNLGKGLGALLSGINTDLTGNEDTEEILDTGEISNPASVAMIPVEYFEVNPWQPRSQFEEKALQELTDSIIAYGLIQPITVRRLNATSYQIISGERRLRASRKAGLVEVPAYIRVAGDAEMMEMALVENIIRADLNPIEVALSFARLKKEFKLTDLELAERVDSKRGSVTNYMRLLDLPVYIQEAIRTKEISMGHAKVILGLKDDDAALSLVFKAIKENNLSVRATESLIASYQNPKKKSSSDSKKSAAENSAQYKLVEDRFRDLLQAPVDLRLKKGGKGQIVINFKGTADLNRILDFLEKDSF